MATSHGSAPKTTELGDRSKYLEKGLPNGRQPWAPSLQTMNLQVRNSAEVLFPIKATSKYAKSKYATSKYTNGSKRQNLLTQLN